MSIQTLDERMTCTFFADGRSSSFVDQLRKVFTFDQHDQQHLKPAIFQKFKGLKRKPSLMFEIFF